MWQVSLPRRSKNLSGGRLAPIKQNPSSPPLHPSHDSSIMQLVVCGRLDSGWLWRLGIENYKTSAGVLGYHVARNLGGRGIGLVRGGWSGPLDLQGACSSFLVECMVCMGGSVTVSCLLVRDGTCECNPEARQLEKTSNKFEPLPLRRKTGCQTSKQGKTEKREQTGRHDKCPGPATWITTGFVNDSHFHLVISLNPWTDFG